MKVILMSQFVIQISALNLFSNAAEKEQWFKNTVFIFTGDHTNFSDRNNFGTSFRVPLLIYEPESPVARRIDHVSSHIDILPTVLEMLSISAVHSSMGSSALGNERDRFVFLKYGPDYVIVSDKFTLVNDFENLPRLYDYHSDPQLKQNLYDKNRAIGIILNTNLSGLLTAFNTFNC